MLPKLGKQLMAPEDVAGAAEARRRELATIQPQACMHLAV